MYRYSNHSEHYKIDPDKGIAVDRGRRVLTLIATHEGGSWSAKPPISEEYPLLLVRTCVTCGSVVSVHAAGNVRGLEIKTGQIGKLFSRPTEYGIWKLIDHGDRFALVRAEGHTEKGGHGWNKCDMRGFEVLFQAE